MMNIDDIMHKIGFIAGKLDVAGQIREHALVELCQECRKELAEMAEEYWKGKEDGERETT